MARKIDDSSARPYVRQMIGDKAKFPVGVNQCVGRLGYCHQWQRVVDSLDIILDDARQKLKLLGQVGILGCVNLGELQF